MGKHSSSGTGLRSNKASFLLYFIKHETEEESMLGKLIGLGFKVVAGFIAGAIAVDCIDYAKNDLKILLLYKYRRNSFSSI